MATLGTSELFLAPVFTQFDQALLRDGVAYVPRRPTVTRGQSSVELEVRLPRNAVVRRFDLRLQARKAEAAAAGEVAQLRPAESRPGGAVLDFGLVRTVAGFDPPEGFQVKAVHLWMGTAFAERAHFVSDGAVSARFDEARTERLLIVLDRAASAAALAADAFVILPEAPADLELRIDGGAPVWTHAGPVIPGPQSEPDAESFSSQGERIAPLSAALAPYVGDPLGEGEVTLRLTLSSRVPGLLALLDVAQEISTVSRAVLQGVGQVAGDAGSPDAAAASRDLDFASEGRVLIDLGLPPVLPPSGPASASVPERLVEEIRFTVLGTLGDERTLDPLWPADEAGEALAELAVDPEHAFAVRLARQAPGAEPASPLLGASEAAAAGTARVAAPPPEPGDRPGPLDLFRLAELTGVHLPLLAGPGGAEARVALWREAPGAPGEPAEALELGISEPLTLDPPAGVAPSWVTFPFKSAVKIDTGERLWAALLVARGEVSWRLAATRGDLHAVRRGGAAGPWLPLPAVLAVDPDLRRRTGAVRVTGRAAKESPLAPCQAALEGAAEILEVTPVAKGARFTLTFVQPRSSAVPRLALTSRLAGKVTLREVDVVWRAAATA